MAYAQTVGWKNQKTGSEEGTPCAVARNITDVRDNMGESIALELDGIWESVKNMAIELCPKESGALASSIELESEGGSGTVGLSGSAQQGEVIYENAIYAGNNETFNFSGEPTSQYAQAVHDGHMLPNGEFWEGTPFLEDALDTYSSEIDAAVANAMDNLLGD